MPRLQLLMIMIITVGFGSLSHRVAASDKPTVDSLFAESYLRQLGELAQQVKVLEPPKTSVGHQGWKELLSPTFGMQLRYDRALRTIIHDNKLEHAVAIFVFSMPEEMKKLLPSFDQLRVSGVLRSEVQTYYLAEGNSDVFVILLSEQKKLSSESDIVLVLSKVIAQKSETQPPAKR